MTEQSNASYLILADKADDPGAMSAAICILVARLEAAEERASMLRAREATQGNRAVRAEAALAKAEAANVGLREALEQMVDEKVDYMQINKLGNPEAQHTIKAARKALATPAPSRVADLVAVMRQIKHLVNDNLERLHPDTIEREINRIADQALAPFPEPEPEVKDG